MGAVLSTMLLIGAMQRCASGYDDEDNNVLSVTISFAEDTEEGGKAKEWKDLFSIPFTITVETKDGTDYQGNIDIYLNNDCVDTIPAEGRETPYLLVQFPPSDDSTIYAKIGKIKSNVLELDLRL